MTNRCAIRIVANPETSPIKAWDKPVRKFHILQQGTSGKKLDVNATILKTFQF